MNSDLIQNIQDMHEKFQIKPILSNLSDDKLNHFLNFRIGCLQEELNELKSAESSDDAVDALIDLTVFALGTLDLFGVNISKAWNEVYNANIVKELGIKATRPNEFGFPDLIKPIGWKAPSHKNNTGNFNRIFND